jgi:hypothetical protein
MGAECEQDFECEVDQVGDGWSQDEAAGTLTTAPATAVMRRE